MHMEEAANLISSLQQTLSEVDEVVANLNERSKRTIMHIETAAQRLIQTITEHRHKLVSKVCEITEAKLRALQGEKELVQDNFKAVEDVLRCAQNTGAVEDSEEWENALSRLLRNLKGVVFDFEEYNEDLKFHFLYWDEKLLAAICKFGDVFTVPNETHPRKVKSHEVVVLHANEDVIEESAVEFNEPATKGFEDVGDSKPLLMELHENFSSPGETIVSEIDNFVEAVLTRVLEETVNVTQFKEGATDESKELSKEGITSEEKSKEEVGNLNETKQGGDDEIAREMIQNLEDKKSDFSDSVEYQAPVTEEDKTFSAVNKEPASTTIDDETINDLNNNSDVFHPWKEAL